MQESERTAAPTKRFSAWIGSLRDGFVKYRLFFAIGLTYAFFFQGSDPNQSSRIFLTQAIVERGALDITPQSAYTLDKGDFEGRFYSDKAPGASFLAIVPYAITTFVGRAMGADDSSFVFKRVRLHAIAIVMAGFMGVMAAACVFRLARALGATGSGPALITVAYALGTNAFPFSTVFFGHQLSAALLIASFTLMYESRDQSASRGRIAAIGGLLGFATITEYPTVPIAVLLSAYWLATQTSWRERRRVAGWALAAGSLPLALHSAYLYAAFGSPFHLPYENVVEPLFRSHTSVGLFGVGVPTAESLYGSFVSRYRGLFFLCPILALFFAGIGKWLASSEHRRECIVVIAIALVHTYVVTSYWAWDGGPSVGPRHMVAAVPFLILPLVFLVKDRAPWRWVVATTTAFSVFIMYVITAVQVHVPEGDVYRFDSLYQATLMPLLRGETSINWQDLAHRGPTEDAAYNLGMLVGMPNVASLMVPLLGWLVFYAPSLIGRLRGRT